MATSQSFQKKSYREEVLESDALQILQIKEAAERDELTQERIDQITEDAKNRLRGLKHLFFDQ